MLVVCSGVIAISDWGTNPGPHWQSSDHSYVEELQLTYYNHTLNYTAHSIETPNHITVEIENLDFNALEIRTNNFQGEINTRYNFWGDLEWIDNHGRAWEAVVVGNYDDPEYTHSEMGPRLYFAFMRETSIWPEVMIYNRLSCAISGRTPIIEALSSYSRYG